MVTYLVEDKEAGGRLDKYIRSRLRLAPDSFIYKMARKKNLLLNGGKCTGREILAAGDEIRLYVSDDTIRLFSMEEKDTVSEYTKAYESLSSIRIIDQYPDLLFLGKPSGILSQKAASFDLSANEYFIGYLLKSGVISKESLHTFHPSVVNRLDRNTSGILICGITPKGTRFASKLLKDRRLHKLYSCLVEGSCDLKGDYDGFLYKDEKKNIVIFHPSTEDFDARLRNKAKPVSLAVRASFPAGGRTELIIELKTGKSHQIRAMLSHFGYPIIGDTKYGGDKADGTGQKLHAFRLEFPKICEEIPELSGKVIEWPAPWQNSSD